MHIGSTTSTLNQNPSTVPLNKERTDAKKTDTLPQNNVNQTSAVKTSGITESVGNNINIAV